MNKRKKKEIISWIKFLFWASGFMVVTFVVPLMIALSKDTPGFQQLLGIALWLVMIVLNAYFILSRGNIK